MTDQAQAVETAVSAEPASVDDRLDAAIQSALNPEAPQEPDEPVDSEATPEADAEPVEPPDEPAEDDAPQSWDEVKEVKLKVPIKNGDTQEEIETTLDELRLGYMRTADYQRKTQEVAAQKNEIQQQFNQALQSEQAKYLQALQAQEAFLMQIAAPEMKGIDWNKLSAEDPAEFVRMSHRANQLNKTRQLIAQQIQEAEAQRVHAQQQQLAQAIPQAQERLKAKIPNWSPELQATLRDTGMKDYGFSAEEIGSILDPRQVEVLHDAMQWRKLQSQKPITEKKIVTLPKVLKPGAKTNPNVQKMADLRARVKKTGGRDESALDQLIKNALR